MSTHPSTDLQPAAHEPSRLTRRAVLGRVAPGLALAAAGLALPGADASAISWCRSDPIIRVNGHEFRLWVLADQKMLKTATGPIEVNVKYPAKATASGELVPDDNGFGKGYKLRLTPDRSLAFTQHLLQVMVYVKAPSSDRTILMRLEATELDGTFITSMPSVANSWGVLPTFWF